MRASVGELGWLIEGRHKYTKRLVGGINTQKIQKKKSLLFPFHSTCMTGTEHLAFKD